MLRLGSKRSRSLKLKAESAPLVTDSKEETTRSERDAIDSIIKMLLRRHRKMKYIRHGLYLALESDSVSDVCNMILHHVERGQMGALRLDSLHTTSLDAISALFKSLIALLNRQPEPLVPYEYFNYIFSTDWYMLDNYESLYYDVISHLPPETYKTIELLIKCLYRINKQIVRFGDDASDLWLRYPKQFRFHYFNNEFNNLISLCSFIAPAVIRSGLGYFAPDSRVEFKFYSSVFLARVVAGYPLLFKSHPERKRQHPQTYITTQYASIMKQSLSRLNEYCQILKSKNRKMLINKLQRTSIILNKKTCSLLNLQESLASLNELWLTKTGSLQLPLSASLLDKYRAAILMDYRNTQRLNMRDYSVLCQQMTDKTLLLILSGDLPSPVPPLELPPSNGNKDILVDVSNNTNGRNSAILHKSDGNIAGIQHADGIVQLRTSPGSQRRGRFSLLQLDDSPPPAASRRSFLLPAVRMRRSGSENPIEFLV